MWDSQQQIKITLNEKLIYSTQHTCLYSYRDQWPHPGSYSRGVAGVLKVRTQVFGRDSLKEWLELQTVMSGVESHVRCLTFQKGLRCGAEQTSLPANISNTRIPDNRTNILNDRLPCSGPLWTNLLLKWKTALDEQPSNHELDRSH